MKKITTIPFSGFYESLHDAALDDAMRNMFSDRETGCTLNEGLFWRAYDSCRWHEVMTDYAKEYAAQFAREFELSTMRFESLQSPKEYNFTTDRIFCEIDLEEAVWIRALVPDEILSAVAAEQFTSRDGFISFYSPNVADWGDMEDWDHNQLGVLMVALVRHVKGDDMDEWREVDLMEDVRCNGYLDDMICAHIPEINRYLTLWDYLNNRLERAGATL